MHRDPIDDRSPRPQAAAHDLMPRDAGHDIRMASVPTKRPREDALPEHLEYRDSGCDLFPSCLTCPLPRCRYEEKGGVRAILNRQRDHEIRRMRIETKLTVAQIAKHFRISRRTVFRALAELRSTKEVADGR